ncbi:hypothetical protein L211DRAFT_845451 [Terfezia boudieri ATCC MYA-4762]|uniref:Uncharacterized protein n=1 Tax=Terfezia boudieri ATCC MYA-4762 TaxID=1051890 RepID=A0A3N4M4X6_9PEZI|nr:hypothetical protein L211DRAFT_845451 [Terfezia boudieri ATCC MYA-4762]
MVQCKMLVRKNGGTRAKSTLGWPLYIRRTMSDSPGFLPTTSHFALALAPGSQPDSYSVSAYATKYIYISHLPSQLESFGDRHSTVYTLNGSPQLQTDTGTMNGDTTDSRYYGAKFGVKRLFTPGYGYRQTQNGCRQDTKDTLSGVYRVPVSGSSYN